ncbi:MAG: NAD(P)/FAD-dependent oxidoreductase [Oscillospiraceae bacterium]
MAINKIVVIGGGPAGLTVAGILAGKNYEVVLLERNAKPARKLMITGKGRCNLTNFCDIDTLINSIVTNGRFLYSAFSKFMPKDTIDFFEHLGVKTKVERGNRVFPVSDKAADVVDALVNFALKNGVKIITDRAVEFKMKKDKINKIICQSGNELDSDAVLIATGGKSYPATGSTGDGYSLAKIVGHHIIAPSPSLVPLTIKEGYAARMQGVSLKNISIRIEETESQKIIYKDFGELLFTHFGVSGPVILSASAHLQNMSSEKYKIFIDMKPAIDLKTLDNRLIRVFAENSCKDFINSIDCLMPKKMVPVIADLSKISPRAKCNQITKKERLFLAELLKNIPFTVTGFRPIEEAIITAGGIDVSEVEPKTMNSKLCDNLYFAGEVLDVDAYTGGFNLQIAFSTAVAAANAISDRREKL